MLTLQTSCFANPARLSGLPQPSYHSELDAEMGPLLAQYECVLRRRGRLWSLIQLLMQHVGNALSAINFAFGGKLLQQLLLFDDERTLDADKMLPS